PLEPPGGGIAAPAGVDEPDRAAGEAQQGVILDDLAVGPRRRDAVAQEDDGVAVPQRELGPRRHGEDRSQQSERQCRPPTRPSAIPYHEILLLSSGEMPFQAG